MNRKCGTTSIKKHRNAARAALTAGVKIIKTDSIDEFCSLKETHLKIKGYSDNPASELRRIHEILKKQRM